MICKTCGKKIPEERLEVHDTDYCVRCFEALPYDRERETRAFEALIVSQLCRERDLMNLDDLPELTDAQRAAMNALPSNLVEILWQEAQSES